MGRDTSFQDISIRPSKIKEEKIKYFFALEGSKTEVNYLKALIKDKDLKSSSIYYLYKPSFSNLKFLVDEMILVVNKEKDIKLTYQSFFNFLANKFKEDKAYFNDNDLRSIIEKYASSKNKKFNQNLEINEIDEIVNRINAKLNEESFLNLDELRKLITNETTFDSSLDKVIVIGDRDKGSFVSTQYDGVINKANSYKITLIITNPCIEFWFLLHFDDAKSLDAFKLLKEDASTYLYDELKKFDPHYSKSMSSFMFDSYIKNKDIAIKHASSYSSSLKELKNKVGTNMPELLKLIDSMK